MSLSRRCLAFCLTAALLPTFLTCAANAQAPTPPTQAAQPALASNPQANAGRKALSDFLDQIADRDLAARHERMERDVTTRDAALKRQSEVRAEILRLLGLLP